MTGTHYRCTKADGRTKRGTETTLCQLKVPTADTVPKDLYATCDACRYIHRNALNREDGHRPMRGDWLDMRYDDVTDRWMDGPEL